MDNRISVGTEAYLDHEVVPEMRYYVVVDTIPFLGLGNGNITYEMLIGSVYSTPLEAYWDGTLIVPPSTKTKGKHGYPFYHKGKW